jgi:hypothetical protein
MLALVTTLGVAGLDVALARALGSDPFLFMVWMIVPVGAIGMGVLALGGFVIGCRARRARAAAIDLPLLMLLGIGLQIAILGFKYLAGGMDLPASNGFVAYALSSVTDIRVVAHSREFGTAPPTPLGEFGWGILIIRTAALLALAKIIHGVAGGDRPRYGPAGTWQR